MGRNGKKTKTWFSLKKSNLQKNQSSLVQIEEITHNTMSVYQQTELN